MQRTVPAPHVDTEPTPQPARPLVVTDDPALLDDLLRLATAAGVEPFVAPTVDAARDRWSAAPLVVVGVEQCGRLASAGLPPRAAVIVAVSADGRAAAPR